MKLSTGAEITFNWQAISQKEWLAAIAGDKDAEIVDPIVGKLLDMTADELNNLNPIDYAVIRKGVVRSYLDEINTGVSKNLAGESTKE